MTVSREVAGGPGPSSVDTLAAGCGTFNLTWSSHADQVNVPYVAGQRDGSTPYLPQSPTPKGLAG
jgi:hypothetical protein